MVLPMNNAAAHNLPVPTIGTRYECRVHGVWFWFTVMSVSTDGEYVAIDLLNNDHTHRILPIIRDDRKVENGLYLRSV